MKWKGALSSHDFIPCGLAGTVAGFMETYRLGRPA
jgi:hypothetical protein